MRILLTGQVSGAMLILSTCDTVIVNFYSMCRFENHFDEIEYYTGLCWSPQCQGAVYVYNDSPWSNLICNRMPNAHKDRVTCIKEKIYEMGGWKPDAIIHIFTSSQPSPQTAQTQTSDKNTEMIFDSLAQDPIPIYSLDATDRDYYRNLCSLIKTICD